MAEVARVAYRAAMWLLEYNLSTLQSNYNRSWCSKCRRGHEACLAVEYVEVQGKLDVDFQRASP